MFDHIAIGVRDLDASARFFLEALAPLHVRVVMHAQRAVGLGRALVPELWLDAKLMPSPPLHLAFAATTRRQVDEFHRRALAAGGQDNGAPGVRPHYHKNYYAAFVIAPEGHNVEMVCRTKEVVEREGLEPSTSAL